MLHLLERPVHSRKSCHYGATGRLGARQLENPGILVRTNAPATPTPKHVCNQAAEHTALPRALRAFPFRRHDHTLSLHLTSKTRLHRTLTTCRLEKGRTTEALSVHVLRTVFISPIASVAAFKRRHCARGQEGATLELRVELTAAVRAKSNALNGDACLAELRGSKDCICCQFPGRARLI